MNDDIFWSSIEATEQEQNKGTYYLRERGLEEHINVFKYLSSFMSYKDRKIQYNEIASVLRYDKRIRRCLFKYIGVVEERLRAHLLDEYRDNCENLVKTKEFNKMWLYYQGDFYKCITHLTFKPLVNLFNVQHEDFKKTVFGEIENMKSNLIALVELRNQVYHNKFLLNNLEFKSCKYNGVESTSLYANIKNLYYFTDIDCKNALIIEINNCAAFHKSKFKNQVDWKLPREVIIKFNKNSFLENL